MLQNELESAVEIIDYDRLVPPDCFLVGAELSAGLNWESSIEFAVRVCWGNTSLTFLCGQERGLAEKVRNIVSNSIDAQKEVRSRNESPLVGERSCVSRGIPYALTFRAGCLANSRQC